MSVPKQCCAPCPDVQTENIPGPEGADGTNGTPGTDGQNAFTVVTGAGFVVPLIGSPATMPAGNSNWMEIGQNIFVEGAGEFEVVSKPTTTSVIANYLDYVGNTATGNTIPAGNGISPGGKQGPNQTLLPGISDYALAGAQALTASFARLLSLSVTLTQAKSYLLLATLRLDFDVATFASAQDVTAKLREVFHGPADIANAIAHANTGTTSLKSSTFVTMGLPPVIYAAAAGDVVELQGIVAATPYSGSLKAVEGSILAIPLF